jgi:hypothetical protein
MAARTRGVGAPCVAGPSSCVIAGSCAGTGSCAPAGPPPPCSVCGRMHVRQMFLRMRDGSNFAHGSDAAAATAPDGLRAVEAVEDTLSDRAVRIAVLEVRVRATAASPPGSCPLILLFKWVWRVRVCVLSRWAQGHTNFLSNSPRMRPPSLSFIMLRRRSARRGW